MKRVLTLPVECNADYDKIRLRTLCASMFVVLCTRVTMTTLVDATDSSGVAVVFPSKHISTL